MAAAGSGSHCGGEASAPRVCVSPHRSGCRTARKISVSGPVTWALKRAKAHAGSGAAIASVSGGSGAAFDAVADGEDRKAQKDRLGQAGGQLDVGAGGGQSWSVVRKITELSVTFRQRRSCRTLFCAVRIEDLRLICSARRRSRAAAVARDRYGLADLPTKQEQLRAPSSPRPHPSPSRWPSPRERRLEAGRAQHLRGPADIPCPDRASRSIGSSTWTHEKRADWCTRPAFPSGDW